MTLAREIPAERLVFVDEMGTNTSLHPLYAWSPRGERARCSVPRNRGPNTTLLASMTAEGMGPCLAVEGATTRIVFEAYIEKVLLPSLGHGQVVVMDNLSAHKGERLRELVESAGCELLYLPPYSRRTSVPLKRPSRRSKAFCVRRRPGAGKRWWRLWVRRSMRSPPETQDVSSSIADTALWVNCFDHRCSTSAQRPTLVCEGGR